MNELIKNKIFEVMDDNSYVKDLHIEFITLEEGYGKGRMKVEKNILNPYNTVHGGALYSLADIVAGCAACTYGNYVCTVSGNMNYVNPGVNTEYIYCEAKVVRQGSHIAVYNVTLTDDNGKILQDGSFNFFVMEQSVE